MRVFLADDQAKVCSALRLLLEQELGLRVVGEATEAKDLLAQVQRTQPDLVLLDWELPGLQATDPWTVPSASPGQALKKNSPSRKYQHNVSRVTKAGGRETRWGNRLRS